MPCWRFHWRTCVSFEHGGGLFFDKDFRDYKHNALTKESLVALALNLIVFGLIGWRLIRWVRRTDSRNLYRAACGMFSVLLIILIDFLRTYNIHVRGTEVNVLGKSPFFIGCGLVVLFVFWHC